MFKLGQANFEFQVKAAGLDSLLPISAEDLKAIRAFHMFVFGEVQIAFTFRDQMNRQVEMLKKLADRSTEQVFPAGFAARAVTYKELAGLIEAMLQSDRLNSMFYMGNMPIGLPMGFPMMQPQVIPQMIPNMNASPVI